MSEERDELMGKLFEAVETIYGMYRFHEKISALSFLQAEYSTCIPKEIAEGRDEE